MKYFIVFALLCFGSLGQAADLRLNPFVGVYSGVSSVKEESSVEGTNLGLKMGMELLASSYSSVALALGFMKNQAQYDLSSNLINLEVQAARFLTDKFRLGGIFSLVGGESKSLSSEEKLLGLYGGLSGQYQVNSSWDVESNLQQRVDEIQHRNILLNLGLKYNF